jgi:hypothetical protein
MLRELIERAEKENLALAPFVGIGRPGLIRDDGSIDPGGQNLPGTAAVVHNDAVVPGISAVPYMRKKDLQLRDTHHWHQPGQRTFLSPGETSSKPRRRIRVGMSVTERRTNRHRVSIAACRADCRLTAYSAHPA